MIDPFLRAGRAKTLALIGCLALPFAPPALAGEYCVGSTVELLQALDAAADDPADDTIRIEQGTYLIDDTLQSPQDGALRLLGGYSAGCLLRFGYAASTVLAGPTTPAGAARDVVLQLTFDSGDSRVERLTFRNFARVLMFDGDNAGALTVNQNRFEDNDTGLVVNVRATDLRIENNHFHRNRNLCCGGDFINRGLMILRSEPAQPITLDVRFNTITHSTFGLDIHGAGPYSAPPRLQNNILWHNGNTDLALQAVDVVATNNIWETESLTGGAGFVTSLLNLHDDPLLQTDGSLTVPDSPAINSGTDFVAGGLTARDVAGNPRKVGSLPDRGAFESPLSDITDLVVTTTANSGAGSLRQAILDANATLGGASIRFDIPGGCPHVIAPTTDLPPVTRETYIDGFSQPGSQQNNSEDAYDAVHCIGIVGGGVLQDGLRLQTQAASDEMSVYGLAFYGFAGNGIHVIGPGSAAIQGNTFGTGLALVILEAGFGARAIRVDDAPYTSIGGYDPSERNVIGRAVASGVRVVGGHDVSIVNNFIGVGTDGMSAIGDDIAAGVSLSGGERHRIEYNRIGHGSHGVAVYDGGIGHLIRSNDIGVTPSGDAIPNGGDGILVRRGLDIDIVDNHIAYNDGAGVYIDEDVQRARVELNRIHDNGALGIDIEPDGVNPEDTDTGAGADGFNRRQNAPELLLAEGGAGSGRVEGELRSANGDYTIVVYASHDCDGSGFGEGQYQVSSRHEVSIDNGTADADGLATFAIDLLPRGGLASMAGTAITATATHVVDAPPGQPPLADTSEFSQCIDYALGGGIFADGFE